MFFKTNSIMNKLLLLILLINFNVSFSQNNDTKNDIQKLAEFTGVIKTFNFIKNEMLTTIPLKNQENFIKDYNESLSLLLEDFEKYYTANFTSSEINEILEFYESPVGKKLSKKLANFDENPALVNEKWSQKISEIMKNYIQ